MTAKEYYNRFVEFEDIRRAGKMTDELLQEEETIRKQMMYELDDLDGLYVCMLMSDYVNREE